MLYTVLPKDKSLSGIAGKFGISLRSWSWQTPVDVCEPQLRHHLSGHDHLYPVADLGAQPVSDASPDPDPDSTPTPKPTPTPKATPTPAITLGY